MGPKFCTSTLLYVHFPKINISQPPPTNALLIVRYSASYPNCDECRQLVISDPTRYTSFESSWTWPCEDGWIVEILRLETPCFFRETFALLFRNISQIRSAQVAAASTAAFWYHIVVRLALSLVWDRTAEGNFEGGEFCVELCEQFLCPVICFVSSE
jgi:hypothetical protein